MIRIKFITDVSRAKLCTSCGGCVGICPTNALTMRSTSYGTFAPQLDETKCTDCRLCLKVCPGYQMNIPKFNQSIFQQMPDHPEIGNFLHTYAGYAVENEIRYSSQSGGLVSALLIYMLNTGQIDGAIVTRWSKEDPLMPETYIARTNQEILQAVGSKYCPVPAATFIKEILKNEGKFAFVGTGCQTHAMRKAAQLKPELKEKIVFHFGLYCFGVLNTHFFNFMLGKHGIARENVKHFAFRSKEWRGWPGDMRIETNSGNIVNIPSYRRRWTSKPYFVPWRCAICPDKLNELADISFGDCRISKVYESQKLTVHGYNPGQSEIICRTANANSLIEQASSAGVIKIQPTDWKDVLGATKASEKKLALSNFKIFSRLLQTPFPDYSVRYYSESRIKRFIFSLCQAPSMLSSSLPFLFHYFAKCPRLLRLLQKGPLRLLIFLAILHEKTTNYHLFRCSKLKADYNSTDSQTTTDR